MTPPAKTTISVTFGEHMKPEKIESMASTFNYGAMVYAENDGRTFRIEPYKESSVSGIEKKLHGWELWGVRSVATTDLNRPLSN